MLNSLSKKEVKEIVTRKINERVLLRTADKHKLNTHQVNFVREYLKNPARPKREIMIAAGYKPSTADNGDMNQLRKPAVIGAIADYIRAGNYNAKIAKVYDKVFNMQEPEGAEIADKIAVSKLQLEAAKEIHKIQGDYAAIKTEKKELHAFAAFGMVDAIAQSVPDCTDGEIIADTDSTQSVNKLPDK